MTKIKNKFKTSSFKVFLIIFFGLILGISLMFYNYRNFTDEYVPLKDYTYHIAHSSLESLGSLIIYHDFSSDIHGNQ